MARLGHGWEEVPSYMEETPRSAATGLYVYPGSRKYPIGDLFHARMALGGPYASSAYTTPARRKKILTEVAEAYPDFDWARYWNTHIVGQKKPTPAKRGGKKKYPLYNWDRSVGASASRRKAANPRRKSKATFSTKWIVGAGSGDTRDGKWKDFGKFTVQGKSIEQAAGRAISILRKKTKQPRLRLALAQEHEDDAYTFEMSAPGFTGAASIDRVMAANPRRKNMARRKNYGALKLLTNPLGMPLGKGQAVVVDHRGEKTPKGGWKGRVHIRKGLKDEALCGAGKPAKGKKRGVVGSKAKKITCYRCIKMRVLDRGDDVERKLVARPSKRATHQMIPGGREGVYVSGVKPADMVHGEPFFLGGPEEHPSQTRHGDGARRSGQDAPWLCVEKW